MQSCTTRKRCFTFCRVLTNALDELKAALAEFLN